MADTVLDSSGWESVWNGVKNAAGDDTNTDRTKQSAADAQLARDQLAASQVQAAIGQGTTFVNADGSLQGTDYGKMVADAQANVDKLTKYLSELKDFVAERKQYVKSSDSLKTMEDAVAQSEEKLANAKKTLQVTKVAAVQNTVRAPQVQAKTVDEVAQAKAGQVDTSQTVVRAPDAITAPTITAPDAVQADRIERTNVAGVDPITGAVIDTAKADEFRQGQVGLVNSINDVLSGKAPSVAELQLKQAAETNSANQQGLAAANSGGGNFALAAMTAANNIAQINQRAAADAAVLRAQEQATARSQAGQVLDSARGADLGTATKQADLTQAAATTNAANTLDVNKTQAQIDADRVRLDAANKLAAATTSAANSIDVNKQNAANTVDTAKTNAANTLDASKSTATNNLSGQTTNATTSTATSQFNAGQTNAVATKNADSVNAVATQNADRLLSQEQIQNQNTQASKQAQINAIATAGNIDNGVSTNQIGQDVQQDEKDTAFRQAVATTIASDKRVKTGIKPDTSKAVESFLKAIKGSKAFAYKQDPETPHHGVMAQDLEKSAIGKTLVKKVNGVKHIDVPQSVGALLGTVAELNKRLSRLEGRRGAR